MPTGYTAKLMEEGQSFKDFTLTCARAFGPCIDLKDEALAPAPKTIKKDSYHEKELKSAEQELARLYKMTPKQREALGIKNRDDELRDAEDALKENLKENKRIDDMLEKTNEWNPPTKEHVGLKSFMIDQLKVSRHDTNYFTTDIERLKKQSGMSRYKSYVLAVKSDIEYHKKGIEEEGKRSSSKNEWLTQLHESLKGG